MNVKDFAKYVIDNLNRATCGNTLSITQKFTKNEYDFIEFIQNFREHLSNYIVEDKMDLDKCYSFLHYSKKALDEHNEGKIDKVYIIDDFLINIWRVENGT